MACVIGRALSFLLPLLPATNDSPKFYNDGTSRHTHKSETLYTELNIIT